MIYPSSYKRLSFLQSLLGPLVDTFTSGLSACRDQAKQLKDFTDIMRPRSKQARAYRLAKRAELVNSEEFAAWRNWITGQRLDTTVKVCLYAFWDAKYYMDRHNSKY